MKYELSFLEAKVYELIDLQLAKGVSNMLPENWKTQLRSEIIQLKIDISQKLIGKLNDLCIHYLETQYQNLQLMIDELDNSLSEGIYFEYGKWLLKEMNRIVDFVEIQMELIDCVKEKELIRINYNVETIGLLAALNIQIGMFKEQRKNKVARIISRTFTSTGKNFGERISPMNLAKCMSIATPGALDTIHSYANKLKNAVYNERISR